MMFEIVKFDISHVNELCEQDVMRPFRPREGDLKIMESSPYAFTAKSDGRVVACAGVFVIWENRGQAWSMLAKDCRKEFLQIHRAVKLFLENCPVNRIEATVLSTFDNGHRWMAALGFEVESECMKAFFPNGCDAYLYARVRK